MKIFPHFHWLSINGIKPNIPENFIREEHVLKTNNLGEMREEELNLDIMNDNNNNNNFEGNKENNSVNNNCIDGETREKTNYGTYNNNYDTDRKSSQANIVKPVIHNISKELQIFLDNFEYRFRVEMKISKINPYKIYSLTKELKISIFTLTNSLGCD